MNLTEPWTETAKRDEYRRATWREWALREASRYDDDPRTILYCRRPPLGTPEEQGHRDAEDAYPRPATDTAPASTYSDALSCLATAAELVEHLKDTEIHALIVGGGEVVIDITTSDAEQVAAGLGLTRETWWLQFSLTQPFAQQWRGTWRGTEVVTRSYSPRNLRTWLRDLIEARS